MKSKLEIENELNLYEKLFYELELESIERKIKFIEAKKQLLIQMKEALTNEASNVEEA